MAESSHSDLHAYATDCLATAVASGEECRTLRTELRLAVTGISQASDPKEERIITLSK